ncbi:MAG: DUF1501 domain-containing protein [Gemmataceae bacterium]
MLTITGSPRRGHCDGVSRRDFMRLGGLGLGALALPNLLRARAETGRARSVIMIYLEGGPSHLDMYDMKPAAPADFRGEFQPIGTNVPGIQICEHLPLQAKIADKLAVVRGVRFDTGPAQPHSLRQLITGFPIRTTRPAAGSVVARVRGLQGSLPPFVSLNQAGGDSLDSREDPSYLGAAYRPFTPGTLRNLTLVNGVKLDQLGARRQLLTSFDNLRRDLDSRGDLAGMDGFTAQALDMISSPRTRDAFDIQKEEPATRDRYGKATRFLVARRLAEAGVPFISLIGSSGWDTHQDNFTRLKKLLPEHDHAVHALIADLYQRGLDKDVAVVIWGEFGRSPRVDNRAGRNHHCDAGFALLSGGGFKTGQVIGETDARGERARGLPYTPENILATAYRHLGINPEMTFPDHTGRPMYVLDDRRVVEEL